MELIRPKDLIDAFREMKRKTESSMWDKAIEIVRNTDKIDAEPTQKIEWTAIFVPTLSGGEMMLSLPVRKGNWLHYDGARKSHKRLCGKCGKKCWYDGYGDYKYCPWCGELMWDGSSEA